MKKNAYLGIDIGSISTNFALLDDDANLLFDSYRRGGGNPVESVQSCLRELRDTVAPDVTIAAVGTTGSGRALIGAMVGADVVKNEISAHARAALHLHPGARTIIEIGGQDSKVTILEDGAVVDFAMNLVCAAGTGSFLDSQARRLEISIEELSERSILSVNPTPIAGRCTVFAESDMIHKQQTGYSQEDILMGLCHSLARNFIGNVARGKTLRPPVLLQGGVSANLGIRRAFEEALGYEIIIPQHHMIMGAFGVALIARDTGTDGTAFRGLEIAAKDVVTRSHLCGECGNQCERVMLLDGDDVIAITEGRCGRQD